MTTIHEPASDTVWGGIPALAWLLLAACWFATIQWRPLLEPDEARYAEIPREMLASGDWVTPRLNGIKYFEKPPLQYWMTAATYAGFGVQEWTSRLWAFALAFLCIPMTYAFARSLHGTVEAGTAAAVALAVNPYFLLVGHLNLLDSAFVFFLTATVFAFLLARRAEVRSSAERRWMLLAWFALACAVLAKGIAALVLTGGTLVVYSAVARDLKPWRRWHIGMGLPLFLLLTVPWFWAVSARNPEFPQFFFIHEHFARFLTTVHKRTEPWWYFLPIVLVGVLPWISQLWPSLRAAWTCTDKDRGWAGRFLLAWCAVVFVFFSISQSKLVPYVMPLMPPLAALLAPRIAADVRSLQRAAWTGFVLVAAVGIGLAIAPQALPWSIVAVLAAAIAIAMLVLRVSPAWRMAAFTACTVLAWQALMMAHAARPPLRTTKSLVEQVRPAIGPDTALFSVGQYRQSVAPYLGRTLQLVAYRGELDFGLTHDSVPYVPTFDAFIAQWQRSSDAVAFMAPGYYEQLLLRGVPARRLASDDRSVVVSRR